ncbi:MAG: chromosome segregation protein, partial [Sphingopyxis sp.]|nr:chromosome segregation protein [Sphingopyxis sp.]
VQSIAALGDGDALDQAVGAAEAAAAAQGERIAAAEAALAAAEAARAAADAELGAADVALAEARAALAALDSETATLTRALASGPSGQNRALDQLRAAPGYETALAAALGDELDAEVGESVARGWRGSAAAPGDPAPPAGTAALADFVTAPPALLRRLRQILVADADLGQPLAIGQRLVTTAGTLRRWDGFVSSGDGAVAAERLARHNRLDQLTARRPLLDNEMQRMAGVRATFADQSAMARETIAAARTALDAADTERRNALRTLDSARGAVERHDAASALHVRRRAELADALRAAQAQLSAEQVSFAALPPQLVAQEKQYAAEQAGDQARANAQMARAAIADHDRTLANIKAQHAITASEAKSWKDRSGEAARRVSDMDKRAAQLARELESLADAPDCLAAARLALEEQRTQRQSTAAAAEAAERDAERAVAAAENALAVQRETLATARETRAGAAARAENSDLKRVEMGRLSGERFECSPPLLPERSGFASDSVGDAARESAQHDQLIADRERLGPVNLVAADELAALDEERARSAAEIEELTQAVNRLRGSIGNLNREGRVRLLAAFDAVNGHFERLFGTLFGGGQAHLELVDADDPLEAGLEIMAQPPGKRLGTLTLLSGGEQALTAVALIFALFLTNPAPICVLDEVDAPLDDANIERFCDLLDAMVRETDTRYLIVTHNAVTMARMHRLFGVTMAEQGVSRLVSVDLGGAEQLLAAA